MGPCGVWCTVGCGASLKADLFLPRILSGCAGICGCESAYRDSAVPVNCAASRRSTSNCSTRRWTPGCISCSASLPSAQSVPVRQSPTCSQAPSQGRGSFCLGYVLHGVAMVPFARGRQMHACTVHKGTGCVFGRLCDVWYSKLTICMTTRILSIALSWPVFPPIACPCLCGERCATRNAA